MLRTSENSAVRHTGRKKQEKHQQPQEELNEAPLVAPSGFVYFLLHGSQLINEVFQSSGSTLICDIHEFAFERGPLTLGKVASRLHLGAEQSESLRAVHACLCQNLNDIVCN